MNASIHPKRITWRKRSKSSDEWDSEIGVVWRGAAGAFHAQASGGHSLDGEWSTWQRAALELEELFNRKSYATHRLRERAQTI